MQCAAASKYRRIQTHRHAQGSNRMFKSLLPVIVSMLTAQMFLTHKVFATETDCHSEETPCLNGGTCAEAADGTGTCECDQGMWTGARCETLIGHGKSSKPCEASPGACHNNGRCWPRSTSPFYKCDCEDAWTGIVSDSSTSAVCSVFNSNLIY